MWHEGGERVCRTDSQDFLCLDLGQLVVRHRLHDYVVALLVCHVSHLTSPACVDVTVLNDMKQIGLDVHGGLQANDADLSPLEDAPHETSIEGDRAIVAVINSRTNWAGVVHTLAGAKAWVQREHHVPFSESRVCALGGCGAIGHNGGSSGQNGRVR